MTVWLSVIGIGADGLASLAPSALQRLKSAKVVFGSSRLHALTRELGKVRVTWPSPFSVMIGELRKLTGQQVAILVTGDPLWYSAGTRLAKEFQANEIEFFPHLSAFQLACARMRWNLSEVETLSVHGRPEESLLKWFAPEAKLVILTSGQETPSRVARLLVDNGFGPSELAVLGMMATPSESRREGTAESWPSKHDAQDLPGFHTLCVKCKPNDTAQILPYGPGLPDSVFETDGVMTKREVRALTISALAPRRGALLWDIGSGSGSVAIEWMRTARDAMAIGIEPHSGRRRMARDNANRLGTPELQLVDGHAPEALSGLPRPDSVFIGGGLSTNTVEAAIGRISPFGRVVANAVSLESESKLERLQSRLGGTLIRVSIQRTQPLGQLRGWKQLMPVTQWTYST